MSEDPQDFVQRIRQLGEQQDQHDAERAKKLEEDLAALEAEGAKADQRRKVVERLRRTKGRGEFSGQNARAA